MVLALTLEHSKTKGRVLPYDIYDVDPNRVAAIRQNHTGKSALKALESFVSDIIKARLPTNLYNYIVTDWSFTDHRDRKQPDNPVQPH